MNNRYCLTLCAFIVDALTHSAKFLVASRSCVYTTPVREVQQQHINDSRERRRAEIANNGPELSAAHLFRYEPETGCSAADLALSLTPITRMHAAEALTRQKVKIEAWFSMAHECLQTLIHINPKPIQSLECAAEMLLYQAMQATAAHESAESAISGADIK